MFSVAEYQLKAEKYAMAARSADTLALRMKYIRVAAICRNKALRLKLGKRADVLRRCPFSPDDLRPF